MTKTGEIVLDSWQEEALSHKGNLLLCTGRQCGKTTIMATKAAEYLVKHKKSQIIVVSLTEDQAKLMILMVLDYLEKKHPKKIIEKGKYRPTQNRITLKNEASILARPVGTTGDAVRGFTGDVLIIDECSKMSKLVMDSAKPILLTTSGEIWICSTPFGKKGYFYETYASNIDSENPRFKVIHVNAPTVIENRTISETWTEEQKVSALEFLKAEQKDMSELAFGQEYLALFLDDLQQFFPDALIEKACILRRPTPHPTHNNYGGADLARLGGDECAYAVIHRRDNTFRHIEQITKKKQLTTKTEQDLLDITQRFNLDKLGIDAGSGSLGVGIYDRLLINPLTKRKVVAMNNRSISLDRFKKTRQRIFKEDMYDNLLGMLERNELRLLDDNEVRLSLKSVQWEIPQQKAMTKIRIFGTNTHIAESLVRAAWLAKKEKLFKPYIAYI